MIFETERDLVDQFKKLLSSDSLFMVSSLIEEFNYGYGKPDIIIKDANNQVIAFEAKLFDINKAINQAYRNNSFADFSYAIFPESKLESIRKKDSEFQRRGIGAAIVCENYVEVIVEPKSQIPYMQWVREKVNLKLEGATDVYG